jgi:pyrimidine deaminase RibD-like protein
MPDLGPVGLFWSMPPTAFPVPGLSPLTGAAAGVAERFLDLAADAARTATCLRSSCGAVVVGRGVVLGTGSNSLPGGCAPTLCLKESGSLGAGFKSDRTCCTHAEVRAITNALKGCADVSGATVYFTRVAGATGARVVRPEATLWCNTRRAHGQALKYDGQTALLPLVVPPMLDKNTGLLVAGATGRIVKGVICPNGDIYASGSSQKWMSGAWLINRDPRGAAERLFSDLYAHPASQVLKAPCAALLQDLRDPSRPAGSYPEPPGSGGKYGSAYKPAACISGAAVYYFGNIYP